MIEIRILKSFSSNNRIHRIESTNNKLQMYRIKNSGIHERKFFVFTNSRKKKASFHFYERHWGPRWDSIVIRQENKFYDWSTVTATLSNTLSQTPCWHPQVNGLPSLEIKDKKHPCSTPWILKTLNFGKTTFFIKNQLVEKKYGSDINGWWIFLSYYNHAINKSRIKIERVTERGIQETLLLNPTKI